MSPSRRSILSELLKTSASSLALSLSFSYFLVRFYLHSQDPLEAFLAMTTLTFLLGFIRKPGTLAYNLYRSIIVFVLSMVFTTFISAFVLIYPFTAYEIDVSQAYLILLSGILVWPFGYVFFSMSIIFMLLGSILSALTQREEKSTPHTEKFWSVEEGPQRRSLTSGDKVKG